MKIAILTTARSDFGHLKAVIRHAIVRFEVDLLIAGSHFLVSRGETVREIEEEFGDSPHIRLVHLDAMDDAGTPSSQVNTLSATQLLASHWFESNDPDLLLFLGDRWELWGVTLPAFLHGIPLAHISGGEVTEGVIDDCIRHSHTKISALHFAAAEPYAKNISQMGEEDWRISVVGESGLDLIHHSEIADTEELKRLFGVDLSLKTILVTFHPSTIDYHTPVQQQIDSILRGLAKFNDYQIVFTAPGVEHGSDMVLDAIHRFVAHYQNAILVDHLGSRNYLATMSSAKVVVGNSSSGLVEASSFGVPAVNIGLRQKNRLAADSVQHVSYSESEVESAIRVALSPDYQKYATGCRNPYDPFRDGNNSLRIVEVLARALKRFSREKLRVKKFDTEVRSDQWNMLLKKG